MGKVSNATIEVTRIQLYQLSPYLRIVRDEVSDLAMVYLRSTGTRVF